MDSILHYTSVSHAGSLMQGVNKMRVSSDFCDVTVVVGNYRILAHKIILSASSPFFYQILKLDTRSDTSKYHEVCLDNIDEIAALKIIEFCYTSAISLDDNIVWPLLEAAIKFQLQEICSLCCEFLTAGLDVSNCVLSLRLAARLRFTQLEENCIRFLIDNLQKASKSSDLISLSPQELSTVLSILEIHGNHIQVIATLSQAWLNWDRKSRVDFVPMLKLLLPQLGDHIQHLLDGVDIPGQDSSSGTSAASDKNIPDECEAKSQVISTSALSTQSGTRNAAFDNNLDFANLPDSDGKIKDISDNNPCVSSSESAATGREFICISCGDEFECKGDLSAHERLCDESVNIVKSVGEKSIAQLPAGFDKKTDVKTTQSSDCQGKTKENNRQSKNHVNIFKSSYSKSDSVEEIKSILTERPTCPKLRRSPRGHRPDFKFDDFDERKSTFHSNVNSIVDNGDDENLLSKSIDKEKCEELDSSKEDKNSTENSDQNLQEETSNENPENDVKRHTLNGDDDNGLDEAAREQTLNIDDNNNNDAVVQDSAGGIHTTADSIFISKNNDSSISQNNTSSEGVDQTTDTHEVKMTNTKEEVLEKGDSFPLKQWRQEHQNCAPDSNAFINSSLKHKCLICSRGFWDRKALTNHWRQDHGVRSFVHEEDENSSSDHEISPPSLKGSKRKCQSPKHAYSPSHNIRHASNSTDVKSDGHVNVQGNGHGSSFKHNANIDLKNDCLRDQAENSVPDTLKVKEEIYDGSGGDSAASAKSFGNYKSLTNNIKAYQQSSSVVEQSQTALKQSPFENVNNEPGHLLNPPFENQMRETLWPQGSTDSELVPTSMGKASQNVNQTANEFFTNYINHYNRLAEWCMTQGTQYCPMCLGYHPVGKPCPKTLPYNGTNVGKEHSKREFGLKDKESKETAAKANNEDEGPLDMSKSSLNFSGGHLTPSSSGSLKSSMNSSGLSQHAFFNYGQLMSESDVLDMSTSRFGDGKLAAQQPGDFPMPLRKSPFDPKTSFGNTFPAYPLHFSTAPPCPASNADPNNSTPNTSTSLPSFSKSSNMSKKKVTSRQGFPCTVCNRVFSYQTALFTHMHTHSPSARSYRCQLCNETFARAPDLKVHVCPNGLEKPYSCPSCGQTFAKNIHLKRHLATHSGLKPYPCWVCGKRFSRSDHLKRHTQSIHAGARPHVCQACGKEFVRKYELNKHMQSHEQTFPIPKQEPLKL